MIKNVIFDFGGVIVDIDRDSSLKAFRQLGCDRVAEWLDPYHQNGFFLDVESGKITSYAFCNELAAVSGHEITWEQAQNAWLAFITGVPLYKLDFLLQLRKTHKVYLLSNTNPFIMKWARSRKLSAQGKPLDAYFDKLFLSYRLKCVKPDASIFEHLINEAPLFVQESLFIDDGPANIQKGQELGFHTLLVKNGEDWRLRVEAALHK